MKWVTIQRHQRIPTKNGSRRNKLPTMPSSSAPERGVLARRMRVLLLGLLLDPTAAVGALPLTGGLASPQPLNGMPSSLPGSMPSELNQEELKVAFLDTLLEAVIDGEDGDGGLADELKNSLIEKVKQQFHAEHMDNPHMKQPWMDGVIDDVFKQMHTIPSQPEHTHRKNTQQAVSGDPSVISQPQVPNGAPDVVSSVQIGPAAAGGGIGAAMTLALVFGVRAARRRTGRAQLRRRGAVYPALGGSSMAAGGAVGGGAVGGGSEMAGKEQGAASGVVSK